MPKEFCMLVLWIACAAGGRAAETTTPATAEPATPRDLRQIARKIEPDLIGKPERLPQYINFFSRELGNDSRICAFDVTAQAGQGKRVGLQGFVEFPETRAALKGFLAILGFEVADHLETLPAAGLGRTGLWPHKGVAQLQLRPAERAAQARERLLARRAAAAAARAGRPFSRSQSRGLPGVRQR